jgi:hypothetical protein
MTNANAASPARRYSRRFWRRLKAKLRIWDFLMGLIPAVIAPYAQYLLFADLHWKSYVVVAIATYGVFCSVWIIAKALLLLISDSKHLETANATLVKLKSREAQDLADILDDGRYLLQRYDKSPFWKDVEQKWTANAYRKVVLYHGKAGEKIFTNEAALELNSTDNSLIFFRRKLENLSRVLEATSPSASQSESSE